MSCVCIISCIELNIVLSLNFLICVGSQHHPKVETVTENENSFPETKTIPAENGYLSETQDKDVVSEGLGVVSVYDQWVAPPVSGTRPKGRYEVLVLHFFPSFSKNILVFVCSV